MKKEMVGIILCMLLIATVIPIVGIMNKNITTPDDEYFNQQQWSLHNTGQTGGIIDCDIDAPEAWDIETGVSDIVIAFMDSGIDYTHPDLASKIWNNENEIPGNGIDDDYNGYIDDIRGWDFYYDDNDPLDENGHGTICAGIAAAVTNNGVGIAGVCWNCQIMPLKVNGLYNTEDIPDLWIEAIEYAVDNGADIISMSLGIEYYHPQLENAVNYAYNNGVFLTASAGNQGWSDEHYPAAYENVIGVAATNDEDKRMENAGQWSATSNYGSWVDVAAPGEDIFSTMPTYHVTFNDYGLNYNYSGNLCGTSCSAPHVAGLAALILSKNPSLSPAEVKTLILENVDPYNSSYDLGTGRINAFKAIQNVTVSIPILISNILSTPQIQEPNGWVNITCNTTAIDSISQVKTRMIYPDDTFINQTMTHIPSTDIYYLNITYYLEGIYTFDIWAQDTKGNQTNSDIFQFYIGYNATIVPLAIGWNQITIPFENNYTASSLGDNITGCILVSYWNNTMDQYQDWIVGWSEPEDDYPILPGRSYFVGMSSNSTFLVEGNPISYVSVPLGVDWNMIGWFNESSTTASSLGDNITGCILVSYWNNTMYQYQDWIVGWSDPEDDYAIHRGMGVFVGMNTASVWHGEG